MDGADGATARIMPVVHFEARERFPVRPEELWPLVSDTHRLNRAMGLPFMEFSAEPLETGGSKITGTHRANASILAFLGQILPLGPKRVADPTLLRLLPRFAIARWTEHPFEFAAPRRYSVYRDYFESPLGLFPFRTFRGGVELTPLDDGSTEVCAFADIEPRNPQGALVTRLIVGPRSCDLVIAQCRNFVRFLRGEAPTPFPDLVLGAAEVPAGTDTPPAEEDAVSARPVAPVGIAGEWERLRATGAPEDLVTRLRAHLESAPDDEVIKMRPFAMADRWEVDRRDLLTTFLRATTIGIVEMSWDVLCPGCRLPSRSTKTLAEMKGEAHCDFCNITYDASVDRQVEVRFTVAAHLRDVSDRRFCTGGPMNVPHLVAQVELAPGEEREIALDLSESTYRLRSPQVQGTAIVEVHPDLPETGEIAVALRREGATPPISSSRVGMIHLRLRNETGLPAAALLEEPKWPDDAATASILSTFQEFRDLFGSEVLAPGLQLSIQRLTFIFTDLTGSTALYQNVGQARAFRLVQDHFGLLAEPIARARGAVVKTIGDAIMAAFATPRDALAAALAMQEAMRDLNTGGAADPVRFLKVGIHAGPCIAVNANGKLDYFGTTINTAARVEHECRGGQIILTDEALDDAARALLAERGIVPETTQVHLRGLSAPITLYCVAPEAIASAPHAAA